MSTPMEERYSEYVLGKARAVPATAIQQDENDPSIWRVVSQRTGTVERVQFIFDPIMRDEIEWRICSCTNGGKRGGEAKCYHAAAAELARQGEKGETDECSAAGEDHSGPIGS